MSTYYDISISSSMHLAIESAILDTIKNETNTWEIIELVHLHDTWEELKEEASAKDNEEYHRWLEQQKLFEKREVDDIFLFHEIKKVLEENHVEKNVEPEFHLICDLADLFQKKLEETAVNE